MSEARCDSSPGADSPVRNGETMDKEEGDSGIDANSQGSCSSNDVKSKEKRKDKKKKKNTVNSGASCSKSNEKESSPTVSATVESSNRVVASSSSKPRDAPAVTGNKDRRSLNECDLASLSLSASASGHGTSQSSNENSSNTASGSKSSSRAQAGERKLKGHLVFEASRPHPAEREDFEATGNETYIPATKGKKTYM